MQNGVHKFYQAHFADKAQVIQKEFAKEEPPMHQRKVERTIQQIEIDRAPGKDGTLIKLIKAGSEPVMRKNTDVFNQVMHEEIKTGKVEECPNFACYEKRI